MSKITIVLFAILLIGIGALFFVMYGIKSNPIISSLTQTINNTSRLVDTTLSFSTAQQSLQPGQTVSVAIVLHNPQPHLDLAQLELAYDPTVLTVNSLSPGAFFTDPTVALQNIDPTTGRISYALRCQPAQRANSASDCVNPTASTLAVITFSVNSYAIKNTTALSFLPKTVIRTRNGRDILQGTTGLQLAITKSLYPVSSASGLASPGANYIRITPIH